MACYRVSTYGLSQVYDGPLEDYFSGRFEDVLTTYKLYAGSGRPRGGVGKASEPVGTLKAIIGAYPALSADGQTTVHSIIGQVPAMPPVECVVRVYIIRVSLAGWHNSLCIACHSVSRCFANTLMASSPCTRHRTSCQGTKMER